MKQIRVIVLKANGTMIEKRIDANIHSYYKELNCDVIDIVTLPLGKKKFDFIIDDEGKLKEHIVNFYIVKGNKIVDYIANDCIICNFKHTENGTIETSLTDEDIKTIIKWRLSNAMFLEI